MATRDVERQHVLFRAASNNFSQASWLVCGLYYFVYCVFRKYLRKKSLQLLLRLLMLAFVALLMLMHAGWPSVPLVCRGLPPTLFWFSTHVSPSSWFHPRFALSALHFSLVPHGWPGLAWRGVGGTVLVCFSRSGPIPKLNLSVLGIISNTVPDSDNKVFIGGLPYNLTEDQVRSPRPTGSRTRNVEHRTPHVLDREPEHGHGHEPGMSMNGSMA